MTENNRTLGQALTALTQLRQELSHQDDAAFQDTLAQLRQWQTRRMTAFHAQRAADYNGQDLLDYLTRRFYQQADWSELTGRPEKVASAVGRIIEHDRPLVITIELQVAAEQLDMALVKALLAQNCPLNEHSYVRTLRRVADPDKLHQQIGWLEELVDLVSDYAYSRTAWWTFRLARTPAHTLGLGKTYELLADGFQAMRRTSDLKAGSRQVIAAQRQLLARLMQQDNFMYR